MYQLRDFQKLWVSEILETLHTLHILLDLFLLGKSESKVGVCCGYVRNLKSLNFQRYFFEVSEFDSNTKIIQTNPVPFTNSKGFISPYSIFRYANELILIIDPL